MKTLGLSDNEQAWLMLVSGILIAVGGVSIPAGLPPWVGLILSIIGVIGLYLKERGGIVLPGEIRTLGSETGWKLVLFLGALELLVSFGLFMSMGFWIVFPGIPIPFLPLVGVVILLIGVIMKAIPS